MCDSESNSCLSMASTGDGDFASAYVNGDANVADHESTPAPGSEKPYTNWQEDVRHGGSLQRVDLQTGVGGWASPPGHYFQVRGSNYFCKKHKSPSGECIFKPLGVDWLRSHSKLDHVLARPDNRVVQALRQAHAQGQSLKSFIFAVNLQIPGRDYHHAIFYFVLDDPIPHGSLLHQFIHDDDDAFRNSRFKLVNRIVKGPWIVRATVGNYAACLLGKALTCSYCKGSNYFEIDVDISSSALANAILHLALGYVNSVTVDMAFLIEAQSEEELPERILGAVRIAHIEMSSAMLVDDSFDITQSNAARMPVRESSWKKFSRSISLLGQGSKSFKDKEPL
ncbi:hypothetical protein L7F22_032251 [Adiantum nelumboides]|nr:hypothetical protein [Adiantum nelumboides]